MHNSGKKILHNLKFYSLKQSVLKESIYFMINENYWAKYIKINAESNIKNLNYILKTYYSKKIYNKSFWNNYLNVLSNKLMQIYNKIILNYSINANKSNDYINLKNNIYYWFKLCKKHNVKLRIIYRQNNNITSSRYSYIYEYARNIKKITSFHNLITTPCVVYDDIEYHNDYHEPYNINSSIMLMENFVEYNRVIE